MRTRGPIPKNPKLSILRSNDVKSTTVYADVIQVQWQSSDTDIVSMLRTKTPSSSSVTRSASALTGGSTKTMASSTFTLTSDPSPAVSTSNGGVSTGAKVGIGVGVPIIVIALAAIVAIFFISRRRKRRNLHVEGAAATEYKGKLVSEMEHDGNEKSSRPVEMDAGPGNQVKAYSSLSVELENRDPNSNSFTGNPGGYLNPGFGTPQKVRRAFDPCTVGSIQEGRRTQAQILEFALTHSDDIETDSIWRNRSI